MAGASTHEARYCIVARCPPRHTAATRFDDLVTLGSHIRQTPIFNIDTSSVVQAGVGLDLARR
jgi:hypothetical protein